MNDKEMTQEESLQVIRQMIDKARNKVTDDGFHFLLWGILVFIACLVDYALIKLKADSNANLVWIIMPVIGGISAFLYERRKRKATRTQTYIDKTHGFVWLSSGITLFLAIFIAVANSTSPIPYILVIIGSATFISGRVLKYVPFTIGGIVFWVSAIVCLAVAYPEQLLINAAAIVCGYIIPGFGLWRKFKNQERVQTIKSAS